jgi:hypothetical protein
MRRLSKEFLRALRAHTGGARGPRKKPCILELCGEADVSPFVFYQFLPRSNAKRDLRKRPGVNAGLNAGPFRGPVGVPPRAIPRTGRGGKGRSKIEQGMLRIAVILGVPPSRAIVEDGRR